MSDSSRISWTSALLCIGFGLYMGTFSGAPLDSGLGLDQTATLFAQIGFYVGIGLGCLWLRTRIGMQGWRYDVRLVSGIYVALTLACLALEQALPGMLDTEYLILLPSVVMGGVAAAPLLYWYDALLKACQEFGRVRCVTLLACSELVSVSITLFLPLAAQTAEHGSVAVFAIQVIASGACVLLHERQTSGGRPAAARPDGAAYRLAPYSAALLICLGVTWGLFCATYLAVSSTLSGAQAQWVPAVSVTCVLASGVALYKITERGNVRFGGVVRLCILIAGITLALLPIMHLTSSRLILPAIQISFFFEDAAIILFSVNVCQENDLPMGRVMPLNFAVFAAAACVAELVFHALSLGLDELVAWQTVSAIGTIAAMSLVPFLPSRASDATTFTLDNLPENEDYASFVERQRKMAAAKYGLTERESDVFERLLRNMTRKQIADELLLSQWTVKSYTTSIYEKVGVHSYKELLAAIEQDR